MSVGRGNFAHGLMCKILLRCVRGVTTRFALASELVNRPLIGFATSACLSKVRQSPAYCDHQTRNATNPLALSATRLKDRPSLSCTSERRVFLRNNGLNAVRTADQGPHPHKAMFCPRCAVSEVLASALLMTSKVFHASTMSSFPMELASGITAHRQPT